MVDVLNAVKMPLEPSIGEFHHPVPLAIVPLQASISYGHPGSQCDALKVNRWLIPQALGAAATAVLVRLHALFLQR